MANENKSFLKDVVLWRIYITMLLVFLGALIVLLRIFVLQYSQGAVLRDMANSIYIEKRPVEAQRGNIVTEDGSLLATSLPYYDVHWDLSKVNDSLFNADVDTLSICLATYIDGELTIGAYRDRLLRAKQDKNRYFLIRRNVTQLELDRIVNFPYFSRYIQDKKGSYGQNDTIVLDNETAEEYLLRMNVADSLVVNAQMLNANGDRVLVLKKQKGAIRSLDKKILDKLRYNTGLIVERKSKRQYPFKVLANRTIGYIRRDSIKTKVGLEAYFNNILAGEDTAIVMQHIGNNMWIPLDDIAQIEPRSGKDIVTTIDINIQEAAHNALLRGLRLHEAEAGCAIVMDVATGDIKAMANLGRMEDGSYWESYNYAVLYRTYPGSTFKIATMMSLYEDEYIHLDDEVDLNYGKAEFFDEQLEDASAHGLKMASIEKAFEVSSNVAMAKLTHKYYNQNLQGQKKFRAHISKFGLDKVTGVTLENEEQAMPLLAEPSTPNWSGITVPWLSVGYEILMTPLQLATFYNAIANNGKMMRPRLVKEVRYFGTSEKIYPPEVLDRKIASDKTLEFARYLLTRPIEGSAGTAKTIKSDEYRIAGKTGTAVMNHKEFKSGREAKKYHASFAGFFPVENPAYTVLVSVYNPKTGFYGGVVAAPIFKEIAEQCYHKNVVSHPHINAEKPIYNGKKLPDLQVGYKADIKSVLAYLNVPYIEEANTAWTVARVQGDSLFLLMRNMQENVVPNVVGMGLRDALYLLESAGIKVRVVGVGKVKSQSVKAGLNISAAKEITLVLG